MEFKSNSTLILEKSFVVPLRVEESFKVTTLKNEFQALEFEPSSELHLLAAWLEFLASRNELQLLKAGLLDMQSMLKSQNIHVVTRNEPDRSYIMSIYYRYLHLNPKFPTSALLESRDTNLYCIFGGQGPNEEYMFELQYYFDTYPSMITSLISIGEKVLGFPIMQWLQQGHPSVEYTASVPVSLPMIGFTQLCQYFLSCRVLNLTPGEMRRCFKGAAGHSQGIVSAVVVSCSDTFESLYVNFGKALKLLKAIGSRAQEAFPITFMEPAIVQDCAEKEGTPSAMLSVVGIDQKLLQKCIDVTNAYIEDRIQISLYNGSKNFVVTGPPKSLYGLVLALRKEKVCGVYIGGI
jgi:hypothetical protein